MDYDKLKFEYLQSAAPLIVRRDELIKQLPNLRKCDCFEVSKRIKAINEELEDLAYYEKEAGG